MISNEPNDSEDLTSYKESGSCTPQFDSMGSSLKDNYSNSDDIIYVKGSRTMKMEM